jgi:hypothetical protein
MPINYLRKKFLELRLRDGTKEDNLNISIAKRECVRPKVKDRRRINTTSCLIMSSVNIENNS